MREDLIKLFDNLENGISTEEIVDQVLSLLASIVPEKKPIVDQDYDKKVFTRTVEQDYFNQGWDDCIDTINKRIK